MQVPNISKFLIFLLKLLFCLPIQFQVSEPCRFIPSGGPKLNIKRLVGSIDDVKLRFCFGEASDLLFFDISQLGLIVLELRLPNPHRGIFFKPLLGILVIISSVDLTDFSLYLCIHPGNKFGFLLLSI